MNQRVEVDSWISLKLLVNKGSWKTADTMSVWGELTKCNYCDNFLCVFTLQNVPEAQCLASQVQLFYATDRQETYSLLETFNHQPDQFKYMSVITELEQSRLGEELRPQQDPPMPTA